MITYKIYEIPTFIQPDGSIGKVGCTSKTIKQRATEQSYSDVYLLEEHTDIYEASNRELEIQAEKGYPVDDIPYWKSIENWILGCSKGGRIGGNTNKRSGHIKRIQKIAAKLTRKLTNNQVIEIRAKYIPFKYSSRTLAKEYNVSQHTILQIINKKIYVEV